MSKKRGKTDLNTDIISSNYISSKLIQEDSVNLEKAKELILNIKIMY